MTAQVVKNNISITLYSALIGSVSGILTFSFLTGGRVEKWDNTTDVVKIIAPMVYKHEGILSQSKTVAPPSATLSKSKYEELPFIPFTELVPEFQQ
jgi:hypothetical protein